MNSLNTHRFRRGAVVALATGMLMAAPATPALAAGAIDGGYIPKAGQIQEQANDPRSDNHSSGTLPFTGLEVGLVAAMGAAFTGLGFGLRKISRETL